MPTKNSLQQLAQIAQINNMLQAPGQEALQASQRAQQNDLATALQVLNLQQQRQQAAEQQQFQQQQLAQSDRQFDAQQGSFGDRNFNEGIQMFGSTADPVARKAVADRYPGINDAQRGLEEEQNQGLLQRMLPIVQAAQGKPDVMAAVQGSLPPEVWQLAMQQIQGQASQGPQGPSSSPSRGSLMARPPVATPTPPAMFGQVPPPSAGPAIVDSSMGPQFDFSTFPTYGDYFGPQVAGTGDFMGYLADLFRHATGGQAKGPQLVNPQPKR